MLGQTHDCVGQVLRDPRLRYYVHGEEARLLGSLLRHHFWADGASFVTGHTEQRACDFLVVIWLSFHSFNFCRLLLP